MSKFITFFAVNWIVQSFLYCTVHLTVHCTVSLAVIRGKRGLHILFRKLVLITWSRSKTDSLISSSSTQFPLPGLQLSRCMVLPFPASCTLCTALYYTVHCKTLNSLYNTLLKYTAMKCTALSRPWLPWRLVLEMQFQVWCCPSCTRSLRGGG